MKYKNETPIVIRIVPRSKPTMTARTVWKHEDYFAWSRQVCNEFNDNNYTLPIPCYIIFFIPMPKSWSKKKKEQMHYRPHDTTKPDKDNLEKAFFDAIFSQKLTGKNDAHVYSAWGEKRWGYEGGIVIYELEPVPDDLIKHAYNQLTGGSDNGF